MVTKEEWRDFKKRSGKLNNPGKKFFLKLASAAICEVNMQRDNHNVLYTRKAMIRCGMANNLNGIWEEAQLFPQLQETVKKYRDNFNGKNVLE
eukprot:IDg799t1